MFLRHATLFILRFAMFRAAAMLLIRPPCRRFFYLPYYAAIRRHGAFCFIATLRYAAVYATMLLISFSLIFCRAATLSYDDTLLLIDAAATRLFR